MKFLGDFHLEQSPLGQRDKVFAASFLLAKLLIDEFLRPEFQSFPTGRRRVIF